MTVFLVKVSEAATMQLSMMGLESYCVPRQGFLETYGLLLGAVADDGADRTCYRIEHVLTDRQAARSASHVTPSKENIRLKIELMKNHWPDHLLIGDIHTHPYEGRQDARAGWKLSDGDREDVEEGNTTFWLEVGIKINLVLSIHLMDNAGWQASGRIAQYTNTAKWTIRNQDEHYRLRLAAYVVNRFENEGNAALYLSPRHQSPVWQGRPHQSVGRLAREHTVLLEIPSVLCIS